MFPTHYWCWSKLKFASLLHAVELQRLWKESLNSDGHQFHQYQQNEQSTLILSELTEHNKDHDIWRWKCMFWLGTGTTMWQVWFSLIYESLLYKEPQLHGAWISFPPPPFLYYPPFFQNFHINHSFFKIFIIIRFSSFDNISRHHTSWIIRVFCVHSLSTDTV